MEDRKIIYKVVSTNKLLRNQDKFELENISMKTKEGQSNDNPHYKNDKLDKIKKKIHFRKNIILLIILILNLNIDITNTKIIKYMIYISKSSIIKLKIYGTGIQYILYSSYISNPNEIKINGINQTDISKSYNLVSENNTVEIKWNDQITDCSDMFRDCSNIYEIDFTDFDASNILKMDGLFRGCSSLKSVNLSNWNVQNVNNVTYLFSDCISLKSIELPNFKNSKLINVNNMFDNCSSLTSLNLSNLNTSEVTTMDSLFNNCRSLTSLNLSNFDTSKVTIMNYLFYNCRLLTSLNLSNFIMDNTTKMNFMFNNCKNLEYLNLKNAVLKSNISKSYFLGDIKINLVVCTESEILKTEVLKSSCARINCSENWREQQKKLKNRTSCIDDCSQINNKYDYLSTCYEACPNGTYEKENYKCEQCHPDCETCEAGPTLNNSNCKSCSSPEKYLNFGNCISECKNGFYFDQNDSTIKICKCDLDKCNICSEESFNMNLCISCNDTYYPKYNDSTNFNSYINCYKDPEGYYLDAINSIYKPCYLSCKSCNKGGNESENNCKICKDDYNYVLNISDISSFNCYNECNYYYYYSNEYNYNICTVNDICPEEFNKLIREKRKCIDNCFNDDFYKYEYNNTCYENCPTGTICNNTNNICFNETIIETSINFLDWDNYSFSTNILLPLSSIINLEEINEEDNIIYHKISTKNQKTLLQNYSLNFNNLSVIDLNGCEQVLREKYNINENDSLIILIHEKKINKVSEKNITFEVFEPFNRTKLNLSLCIGIDINIYIKTELNGETIKTYQKLRDLGYNMFNINDPFYQDICIPYTTEEETDIILIDRIEYIYNNEDTKCQKNCKFDGYSIETNYVNCTCDIDNDFYDEQNKKLTNRNVFESFIDVLKYSNYKILKCYRLTFSKKNFQKNIGSIIILLYFLIYLGCFLSFIIQGVNPLKIKLLKNMKKDHTFNQINTINKKNLSYPPRNSIINNNSNSNINFKFIRKKSTVLQKEIKRKKSKIRTINKKKSCIELYSKFNVNDNTQNKLQNSFSLVENKTLKESIKNQKNNKEEKNEIKNYDTFELNELEYLEAIKYDKRSFMKIYVDTIKREHIILFTFFVCNDYNLLFIKLIRFIILTTTDMAMNVFFFSDESMHKIYLTYGKYDFIQQIEQIFYSTLVSQLMETFLCFLSLTDKHIYKIKSLITSKISDDKNKMFKLFLCIKIKLIFFCIFTFLLLISYWYIVSTFCAVYENTQIIFIKDCIFSFLLNLLYPFIIYLIPCGLRIYSLKDQKGKMGCLYKFSEIIPFF